MRAATLHATACAILLTAPGALADAGREDDAPGDHVFAWDVPLGHVNGTLGGSDAADWYRVDPQVNATTGASLIVKAYVPVEGYRLQLRSDNGTLLKDASLSANTTTISTRLIAAIRLGIYDPSPDNGTTNNTTAPVVNYTLFLDVFTPPPPPPVTTMDLAVTALWVENVPDLPYGPVTTDMGQPSTGTRRIIHVEVANEGNETGRGWLSVVVDGATAGLTYSVVHHGPVELASGERRWLSLPWNARGAVGDVDVTAHLDAWGDADPKDNWRTVRHYAIVGGTGVGIVMLDEVCSIAACVQWTEGNVTARHTVGPFRIWGNASLLPPPSASACAWGPVSACAWA